MTRRTISRFHPRYLVAPGLPFAAAHFFVCYFYFDFVVTVGWALPQYWAPILEWLYKILTFGHFLVHPITGPTTVGWSIGVAFSSMTYAFAGALLFRVFEEPPDLYRHSHG